MEKKLHTLLNSLRDEFARLFIISTAVFLFVLFFHPFPLETLDYDNRLLYVTGFGVICLLISILVFVLLPLLFPSFFNKSEWENGPASMLILIFLSLTIASLIFYIRYVGFTELKLFILFKVVMVSLIPVIILNYKYKTKSLEDIIRRLKDENHNYAQKISECDKNELDEEIEIFSSSKTDKIKLKQRDIIYIKSADNYVEIYYLKNDELEKKLLRNTLKDIEKQLKSYNRFIRCHRTCISNSFFMDKLTRSYTGYGLKMNHVEEKLPVSRQYLKQLKEAIFIKN